MRCTISDLERVNAVMRHPEVYPFIADDGCPSPDQFTAEPFLVNPFVYVLMPNDGTVFVLIPWNSFCFEVHTNIIPEYRGKTAVRAGRQSMAWMFMNSQCLKMVTQVPDDNERAKMFALLCGMKVEGKNEKSYLKDGELYDQTILGITRERWRSCQQPG